MPVDSLFPEPPDSSGEDNFNREKDFFGQPASSPPPSKKSKTAPKLPDKFTVTQITRLIKQTLTMSLPPSIVIEGEISNLRQPASGHWYFDLKDANAVLPAVVWRSSTQRIKFNPVDGQAVIATGTIDLYEPHGKYQLSIKKLQPAGLGVLELAFRQLAEKLRKEGLFDPQHKKPIPRYPKTIAIVTSATGAAIQDIRQTLARRYPIVRQVLYPVAVQGDAAPKEIAAAIRYFNRHAARFGGIDVMIVGRGGGSLEDLWAFNEEIVARAIYESSIPIVSAVGHEVDTTIADYVADCRVATPTAAAEMTVPVLTEVTDLLAAAHQRLRQTFAQQFLTAKKHLEQLACRPLFVRPLDAVNYRHQTLDQQTARLNHSSSQTLRRAASLLNAKETDIQKIEPRRVWAFGQSRLMTLEHRLAQQSTNALQKQHYHLEQLTTTLLAHSPQRTISQYRDRLQQFEHRLTHARQQCFEVTARQLSHAQRQLENLNPKNILRRGYSITRRLANNTLVDSHHPAQPDEIILTELADQVVIPSRVVEPLPQKTSD